MRALKAAAVHACMHLWIECECVRVCVRYPPLSISSRPCSCPTDKRLSSRPTSWMRSGPPWGSSPSPYRPLVELWWARGYELLLSPGQILLRSYFTVVLNSFQLQGLLLTCLGLFCFLPRSRLFWLISPDLACQTVLQMCTVEFGFPGFKAQAVAMRPLSTVAGIPFMYSWSPLQHNFMVWRSFLGCHILLLLLRPHFPLLKSTCCV